MCATQSQRNTSVRHAHSHSTYRTYQCPICTNMHSCSLSCFKEHKPTHAGDAPALAAPIPRYLKKKIDFSVLATNPKFQELLKTYPTLLPALQRVYAATIEPEEGDQPRRGRGGKGGFRGRGGRGRGRGGRFDDAGHKWTPKQGDNDALRMLKGYRGREEHDKEKQAMAAFVQLVEETFGDTES